MAQILEDEKNEEGDQLRLSERCLDPDSFNIRAIQWYGPTKTHQQVLLLNVFMLNLY